MRISKLETTTSQLLQHIHNKILDFYKFRVRFFNKNRHLYCQILANQIIPILQNSIYYLYMTAVIGIKIENRIVDIERKRFPISSTIVRKNYKENSKYIENFIYTELNKKTK